MPATCVHLDVPLHGISVDAIPTLLEVRPTSPATALEVDCEDQVLQLNQVSLQLEVTSSNAAQIVFQPKQFVLQTTPVGTQGPQGVQGPAGDLNYVHTQGVAATEWVIAHGLGKNFSVTAQDSIGRDIEVEILENTTTLVRLGLSYPTSGKAFLN